MSPENADHQSDEQGKLEPHEHEKAQTDEQSVDQAHQELASEEIDEVIVDFAQKRNDLALERRGPQRKIIAPVVGDRMTLLEKEKQKDGNEDRG